VSTEDLKSFGLDIYLDSTIGTWFSTFVEINQNDIFFVADPEIAKTLRARGAMLADSEFPRSRRGLSIHWKKKFLNSTIEKYDYFFNIHPGFLPIGRGTFPIFWSVFLNQKAGVTVHQISNEIDFGPIFRREEVSYSETDSAGVLWEKIFEIEKLLVMEAYNSLKHDGKIELSPCDDYPKGHNRRKKEFEALRDFPEKFGLSDEELLRLRLALTHPRYEPPDWMRQ